MAGSSFVAGISGFCAVINAFSILIYLLSIRANDFPMSGLFNFANIAVTGLSLCSDLLLLTSAGTQGSQVNPMGTSGSLNKTLKMMLWAICIKVFVITYEFFTAPLYSYNCYLDVVILYYIHDFYEGVKQQGTLNSNGLLNDEDMQLLRGQAFPQGMPAFLPSGYMMAPGAPMQGLYPTNQWVVPGASMQGVYPGGGMMAQPGAQGYSFYPAGGMMAQPGAQGYSFYPAGGMMAQPGALGQGFYPAGGMMGPPRAQGQGFYIAGMMAQPGAQGQGSYPAGTIGTPGAPVVTGGSAVANTQSNEDAASPSPAKPRHRKGSVAKKPHANYSRSTN
ncbi:uncharacterized protein [Dermacentor albipictus]|uniref:uncharacterized protein isoform X6 n=1 Tax=Dermacentor albipictus TaxID=60249 RepID=UPI0031FC8198